MSLYKSIALSLLLSASFSVVADSLPITPGMWETTMNQTNSFTGSNTTVNSECVKETEFDPNSLMEGNENCSIADSKVSGNRMQFAMECNMDGSQAKMNGEFESNGDNGSGKMTMTMYMTGQKIEMEMDWTARRVGDC